MILIAAVLQLIIVHMIDGRAVDVNPRHIVSLAHPKTGANKQFPDAVRCVISLTDGKFLSVAETCDEIRQLIGGKL